LKKQLVVVALFENIRWPSTFAPYFGGTYEDPNGSESVESGVGYELMVPETCEIGGATSGQPQFNRF
jgi:hypothetical protein